jgi:hypothetical protein
MKYNQGIRQPSFSLFLDSVSWIQEIVSKSMCAKAIDHTRISEGASRTRWQERITATAFSMTANWLNFRYLWGVVSPSERDCLFAYPSMTTVSRNATTKMDLQPGREGRLSAG